MFGGDEDDTPKKDPDEIRKQLELFRSGHMKVSVDTTGTERNSGSQGADHAQQSARATADEPPPYTHSAKNRNIDEFDQTTEYEDGQDEYDDHEFPASGLSGSSTAAHSEEQDDILNIYGMSVQDNDLPRNPHVAEPSSSAGEVPADSGGTQLSTLPASTSSSLASSALPPAPRSHGVSASKSAAPGVSSIVPPRGSGHHATKSTSLPVTASHINPHARAGSIGSEPSSSIASVPSGPKLTRGTSDASFLSDLSNASGMKAKRVASANDLNKDIVLARSSVPYSSVFPIRDQQVGPHHFRTLKLLGRGGIGRVFLVQLKGTSLLYAMKVLTKDEMIQRNKVKRVMTEREILATANHPFVVTMYASFQTVDRLCFVMEYCAGGEFFKVLQRQPKRRLREEAVKFYAAEVTLALEYLHHMGFIYRDLKPENILLRESGHIALTDFDLSKQAHAVSPRVIQQQLSISDKIKRSFSLKRNNSSLTNLEIVDSEPILPYQTNSFVGTEDYISPEIINGVGQTSAVDWWTLGILIYEMLTGTTPFKGGHADETFNNIVSHQVKWPDDVQISYECKQVVKRLLRREPDKRLGAENGATDIKRAKWFSGFNFALVRNATPPIIPRIRNPLDFSQYPGISSDDASQTVTHPAPEESGDYDNKNPDNPFMDFNIRRDSEIVQRKY